MIKFESVGSVFHLLEPHVHPSDKTQEYLHYGLYFDIAQKVSPSAIIEIGVRFGYSAIVMLHGCGGKAAYFGFDNESYGEINPNEYAQKHIREIVMGMSLPDKYVGLICEVTKLDTQRVNELPGILGKVDLIHVDGAHYADGVLHDLDLVYKYATEDAYIIVDDTGHKGQEDVGKAAHEWAEEHSFEFTFFPENCGRTVMTKRRS